MQASVTLAKKSGSRDSIRITTRFSLATTCSAAASTRRVCTTTCGRSLVWSTTSTTSFTAGKTRSVYTVTFGSDPPNVAKARDLIVRDLRAMQTDNVTPEELHQAKALLLRQMALQQSSEDAIAGVLLARAQIGLPLDESRRMGQRYYDLTADEVRAAFAKWIRPQDFVQVVRGPQP